MQPQDGMKYRVVEHEEVNGNYSGNRLLLRTFVFENSIHEGKPLYEALLNIMKEEGCAEASVMSEITGFGPRWETLANKSNGKRLVIEVELNKAQLESISPKIEQLVGISPLVAEVLETWRSNYEVPIETVESFREISNFASGGLVFDRNQFLLIKRMGKGEIRIPKGHLENGETVEQAALREVTEETGYADLVILDSLGSQVNKFERNKKVIERQEYCFLLGLTPFEPRANTVYLRRKQSQTETDRVKFSPIWVPYKDVVDRLTYKVEKEFARRALEKLKEMGKIE